MEAINYLHETKDDDRVMVYCHIIVRAIISRNVPSEGRNCGNTVAAV